MNKFGRFPAEMASKQLFFFYIRHIIHMLSMYIITNYSANNGLYNRNSALMWHIHLAMKSLSHIAMNIIRLALILSLR